MTTKATKPIGSDEAPADRSLKRRGLFAAAWALVAAAVLRKGDEKVEATSGTGPDGNLVIGSNEFDNQANYASRRTYLISGLSFSGYSVFEASASPFQSSGSPDAAGIIGTPRGTSAGVVGLDEAGTGPKPSGFPANLKAGVFGSAYTFTGRGVVGMHLNNGTGVVGQSNLGGIGVQGVIPPTNIGNATAVYGLNYSNYAGSGPGAGGFGVYGLSAKGHGLVGAVATAGAAAVVGATNGVAGAFAGAFYGPVLVGGDFTVVNGAKSAAVPHPDGTHRRLYCLESPESWFEDFGTGRLECGRADVPIDPDFAAVANLDQYHVFLTEYDTDAVLRVRRRTKTGFEVEADLDLAALKGKKETDLTGEFSWRVVAKRKDITGQRLAPVTIPSEPRLPEVPDFRATP
jgi:hypothetical protein